MHKKKRDVQKRASLFLSLNMTQEQIILHLSLIDGIGPQTVLQILSSSQDEFTLNELYQLSIRDCVERFSISAATAKKLVDGLSTKKVLDEELALIEHNDIQWCTIACAHYPEMLKNTHLPPPILYWQGAVPTTLKTVAFVGSRLANAYGERAISLLIPELVYSGCTIVSGGALGIDTLSHKAALQAGGKTVAVVGTGLLKTFPAENKKLFKEIVHNGGSIISSFPLNMGGLYGNFPARNRIISGLSYGTVVVQAAKKSGSLITANYALEQGREVFAVPGPIDDQLSMGCHSLIQQGAKLVSTASDILTEFGWMKHSEALYDASAQLSVLPLSYPKKAKQPTVPAESIQAKVINLCVRPSSIDEIASQLEMNLFAVQTLLFDMQLEGLLEQDFAGLWRAKG